MSDSWQSSEQFVNFQIDDIINPGLHKGKIKMYSCFEPVLKMMESNRGFSFDKNLHF